MVIGKEHIKYSLRNLNKSKGRSALTIFSILIGITTLFIFMSFGVGLYNYVESFTEGSSVNKILVQAKGSTSTGLDTTFKLTDVDLRAVQSVAGVEKASGVYFKASQIKQDETIRYVFLSGYDPDEPIIMDISDVDIVDGRWLRSGEKNKVILGYNFKIDKKIMPKGYSVGETIEIDGKEFRIVGFLDEIGNPQDDSNMYISIESYEETYPKEDSYAMIVAQVDVNNIDDIIEKVENKLRNVRDQEKGKEDFYVQSFKDLIESFSTALDFIVAFILVIALVSVIVSAVNTANTMITSVLERYKEIGILKAVGARNAEIFKIFLFESAFLGFVAGCIGVLIGFGITSVAEQVLSSIGYGFLQPSYSGTTAFLLNFLHNFFGLSFLPELPAGSYFADLFIGCITFATLTGAISGFFPARNAAKTNTVNALRYE